MKDGFTPISINDYVNSHLEVSDIPKRELLDSVATALKAYKNNKRCSCGNHIWVIGSAAVGHNSCFGCITGESVPNDDYEIDEACIKEKP